MSLAAFKHPVIEVGVEVTARMMRDPRVGSFVVTAVERTRTHGVRRLPIVDGEGKTVGIVTVDDLLLELGAQVGALCGGIENNADASDSQ